jgi:hypothetical protein
MDHHVGTGGMQVTANRRANPSGASGNEDDFALHLYSPYTLVLILFCSN